MSDAKFDLVVIGAGSAGLVAADFAARTGARVALVERDQIGGDCTRTGCIPSKALRKAAKVAHTARTARIYGIVSEDAQTDMSRVRDYVRGAVEQASQAESAEYLRATNIALVAGDARFVDCRTIAVGDRVIRSSRFVIATGARPQLAPIDGLARVPFVTHREVFENDRLPRRLIVVGGGPVGLEVAQAYQRLGSQVTVVGPELLPKEDEEVRRLVRSVLAREGVRFLRGRAEAAHTAGNEIVVRTSGDETQGDMLLVATGRASNIDGLDLDKAGVRHSEQGIEVDHYLQTTAKNIYAAGDAIGGQQYTHLAAWHGFIAARNALFPGRSRGTVDVVPRITFTDPEIAHVGPSRDELRSASGDQIEEHMIDARRIDRAICENDGDAFIRIATRKDGTIVAATVVADHAGETLNELMIAMTNGIKLGRIANTIHAYPTNAIGVQQLAADAALDATFSGFAGRAFRSLSKVNLWVRP